MVETGMKEKIIKILQQLGLMTEENQTKLSEQLDNIDLDELLNDNEPAGGIQLPGNLDSATRGLIEKLIAQNKALAGNIKILKETLAEETKQREAAIKAERERQEKEAKQKIAAAVEKLLEEKRITEADKEIWLNLYEKDFENAEKVAAQLKPAVAEKNTNKNTQSLSSSTQEKTASVRVDRNALKAAIAEQMESYSN